MSVPSPEAIGNSPAALYRYLAAVLADDGVSPPQTMARLHAVVDALIDDPRVTSEQCRAAAIGLALGSVAIGTEPEIDRLRTLLTGLGGEGRDAEIQRVAAGIRGTGIDPLPADAADRVGDMLAAPQTRRGGADVTQRVAKYLAGQDGSHGLLELARRSRLPSEHPTDRELAEAVLAAGVDMLLAGKPAGDDRRRVAARMTLHLREISDWPLAWGLAARLDAMPFVRDVERAWMTLHGRYEGEDTVVSELAAWELRMHSASPGGPWTYVPPDRMPRFVSLPPATKVASGSPPGPVTLDPFLRLAAAAEVVRAPEEWMEIGKAALALCPPAGTPAPPGWTQELMTDAIRDGLTVVADAILASVLQSERGYVSDEMGFATSDVLLQRAGRTAYGGRLARHVGLSTAPTPHFVAPVLDAFGLTEYPQSRPMALNMPWIHQDLVPGGQLAMFFGLVLALTEPRVGPSPFDEDVAARVARGMSPDRARRSVAHDLLDEALANWVGNDYPRMVGRPETVLAAILACDVLTGNRIPPPRLCERRFHSGAVVGRAEIAEALAVLANGRHSDAVDLVAAVAGVGETPWRVTPSDGFMPLTTAQGLPGIG